ncbi:MAG: DUF1456 family protein [Desulfotalea sp.]
MNNNDVLRRIRYAFDFDDFKMIEIFKAAACEVTRVEICEWSKKNEDPDLNMIEDVQLATFLNGLINDKRGKKEGPQAEPETSLTSNIILVKLKIALNLQADGVLDLLSLAGQQLSKSELSAFFRKPGHKHYRECPDEIFQNFLNGMQLKYRKS